MFNVVVCALAFFALAYAGEQEACCPTTLMAAPSPGQTVYYYTSNTCDLAQEFTFYPPDFTGDGGEFYVTATVDGTKYSWSTSLNLQAAPGGATGFEAVFPVEVGTITGAVPLSVEYYSSTFTKGYYTQVAVCDYCETIYISHSLSLPTYFQTTTVTQTDTCTETTTTCITDTITDTITPPTVTDTHTITKATITLCPSKTTTVITITPPPCIITTTVCTTITTHPPCAKCGPKRHNWKRLRERTAEGECTAAIAGDFGPGETITCPVTDVVTVTVTDLETVTDVITVTTTTTGPAPTTYVNAYTCVTITPPPITKTCTDVLRPVKSTTTVTLTVIVTELPRPCYCCREKEG